MRVDMANRSEVATTLFFVWKNSDPPLLAGLGSVRVNTVYTVLKQEIDLLHLAGFLSAMLDGLTVPLAHRVSPRCDRRIARGPAPAWSYEESTS